MTKASPSLSFSFSLFNLRKDRMVSVLREKTFFLRLSAQLQLLFSSSVYPTVVLLIDCPFSLQNFTYSLAPGRSYLILSISSFATRPLFLLKLNHVTKVGQHYYSTLFKLRARAFGSLNGV